MRRSRMEVPQLSLAGRGARRPLLTKRVARGPPVCDILPSPTSSLSFPIIHLHIFAPFFFRDCTAQPSRHPPHTHTPAAGVQSERASRCSSRSRADSGLRSDSSEQPPRSLAPTRRSHPALPRAEAVPGLAAELGRSRGWPPASRARGAGPGSWGREAESMTRVTRLRRHKVSHSCHNGKGYRDAQDSLGENGGLMDSGRRVSESQCLGSLQCEEQSSVLILRTRSTAVTIIKINPLEVKLSNGLKDRLR